MKMNITTLKEIKRSLAGIFALSVMAFPLMLTQACNDLDEGLVNEGTQASNTTIGSGQIVTVRRSSVGRTYFQLDQDVTLDPKGWVNPYSREVRALLSYSELKEKSDFCTKSVKVEKIDSLPTINALYIDVDDGMEDGSPYPVFAVDVGYSTTAELMAASNPVDIVSDNDVPDWMTFCEDGYLTVHFATFWGDVTPHTVNLYSSRYHPNHLYFVHKDNGDIQKDWGESFAAFKIAHLFPSRKDGYSNPDYVVLHWMSFNGEKTIKLKYRQRAVEK